MSKIMRQRRLPQQHRGLRSYVWTWVQTAQLLALLAIFWCLVNFAAPYIIRGWADLLAWAWPRLALGPADSVSVKTISTMGIRIDVVRTQFIAPAPTLLQWWLGALMSIGAIVVSFVISRERLPLVYSLRILGVLGLVSLLCYEFEPTLIVNDVNRLLSNNMLDTGLAMLWILPFVHAMVLYIFPMPLLLKAVTTFFALLFTTISIPFQAASLALLATSCSLLVAIPAFMLLTFLPQIVAQLGIYGFFMSLTPIPD